MRKITKLFSFIFSFGLFVIQGQNLPQDLSTYDKSKHLVKRTTEIPADRIEKECVFFGGDSLAGFDLSSALKQSLPSYNIYREFKLDIFRKEAAFIKKKYSIAQLPFEAIANQKIIEPTPEVMTACSNVDFESGSFAGWTGKVGYNALSTNPITVTSTGINTAGIDASYRSCSYHTLTTAAGGNDFYGNFPTHYPGGGTYSVRLGGENANVYDGEDCNYPTLPYQCHSTAPATTHECAGERLEQTFTVSATNSLFTFSYAAVLNDGGHGAGHQPYFKIEVLDPSNNPIACFTQRIELIAGVAPPGGFLSSNGNCWFLPHVSNDDYVYYIPWTTNSYNLSAYSGSNVTVRFTAAGCTDGDHFGYAYFDASCGPAAITTSNASPCNGQAVTLTAPTVQSGSYAWSGPGIVGSTTGQSVNINAAGTYSVTVGTGPCAYVLTIPVTYGVMAGVTANPTAASLCNGQSTTLNGSAATSYTWTPAGTLSNPNIQNPVATPTTTTVYTLTVTSGGCTGTATATVTVNSAPTLTLTPAASSICIGNNTSITAGGATTYTWTPSGSLSGANGSPVTATPTTTTTYTINATDGNGCTNNNTVTITVNPLPTLVLTPISSTLCSGTSTSISAAGASTYTWTPSGSLSSANGSPVTASPTVPTTYTVNGTDLNGCQNSTTVSLGINALPTLTVTPAASSVCSGVGTTITASGANTYTWTPSGSLSSPNGSPVTATPTVPTTYTVTGTDLNGCQNSNTVSISITAPSPISANAADPAICNGGGTMLFASGASTYTWTPSGSLGSANGSPVSANPTSTTTYTVTGTDAGGCTSTQTVVLTVNQPPVLTAIGSQTVCSGSSVNTISFVTTPAGGNINWTNSNTGIGLGVSGNGDISSYTPTATTMQSGTITATPVDAGTACAGAPQTFTITVNPLPLIDTTAMNITDAGCGQSNGCISGIAGQAPGTYQYSWDNGTTWNGSSQNCSQPAGSYSLQVQDMTTGCITNGTYAINNLNGPAVPVVLGATTACAGDSVNLNISGPQGGITYTWTDAAGTSTGISHTVYNIGPSGTYTVSVTASDINSCSNTTSTSLTVNAPPVSTLSGTAHFCAGNNTVLSANPSGGTYTYQWNMNGSAVAGATSSTYTATTAGNYNVEITDNTTTCKAASTNLNVSVDALPVIDTTTSMVITATNCNQSTGSVISVVVTPNNANNTYSWTDGSGNVVGTSLNLTNIAAGNYCLAVTDSNGCSSNICGMTVTNAGAPNLPTLATPNNTYCQGQTINPVSVSGTGTFTWYSDVALTTQVASGTTYTPTASGTYYVTASNNGCTSPALPVTITVNNNPPTPLVTNPANAYCQGQPIGTITASGTGTILWSTSPGMIPVINTGNTYTPSGLAVGTTTYYLVDSSAAGCLSQSAATTSVTINAAPADPAIAAPSALYCQGDVIQPVTANGTGTVLWYSDANHTQLVNTGSTYTPPATMGTSVYYLLDSSAAGCKSAGTATVTVVVNPVPATPGVSAPGAGYCQGQTVNGITATGTGTILWSTNPGMNPVINTGNTYTPSGLASGTTTYYLIDSAAGCKSLVPATTSITIHPSPVISGTPTIDSAFCGLSTGDILNLNVSSGTPQYTYQWLNTAGATVGTSLNLTAAAAGTYTLIVVDANQCSDTSNTGYTIFGNAAVNASFTPSTTQGPPTLNVNYTNTSTGASSYAWSLGDGTFSTQLNTQASYAISGTYTVTMIASNSHCTDTASVLIIVDVPSTIVIPNVFTPNGDGTNDGFFIDCKGIRTLRCDIYNRWGQLVYTLFAPNDVWNGIMNNGNAASDGTYYYILDAVGFDAKEIKAQGYILLTR